MADIRLTDTLDNFSILEDPLGETDGRWAKAFGNPTGRMLTTLHVGVATASGISGAGDQVYYWTPETFVGNVEVWGQIHEQQEITEGWRMGIFNASSVTTGYQLIIWDPIGSPVVWQIRDGSSSTVLQSVEWPITWGDLVLCRRINGVFETWRAPAPGGEPYPGPPADGETWEGPINSLGWVDAEEVVIAIGTATDDPDEGWTKFGGGVTSIVPQIYRRPNE
jgi:hypothetical protein